MVLDVVDLPERGDVGEVAVHEGLALLAGLLDAEGRGLAVAQQLRPVHVGTGSGVPLPPAPLHALHCCWPRPPAVAAAGASGYR